MCGIVGAVAERDVVPILIEGLTRLEYRGYDSAGIATFNNGAVERRRRLGKVAELQAALDADPVTGHNRYRTHPLGHAWHSERRQRTSACIR